MNKLTIFATCVTASLSAGSEVAADNGFWCASKLTSDEVSSSTGKLVSFRGEFRDFSLFVENTKDTISGCDVFKSHIIGDDGLWVIEEPSKAIADETKSKLTAAGLPIYFDAGASFIVGGGTEVPNISGLDGCGADEDTSFIPVPSHSVRPPLLSAERVAEWSASIQTENPVVAGAVAAVSESALIKTVQSLQEFHTRNSYSETIHQAQEFISQELIAMGFDVEYMQFRSDMSANIIATLPGDYDEWVVAGAHYDSRATNSTSGK